MLTPLSYFPGPRNRTNLLQLIGQVLRVNQLLSYLGAFLEADTVANPLPDGCDLEISAVAALFTSEVEKCGSTDASASDHDSM